MTSQACPSWSRASRSALRRRNPPRSGSTDRSRLSSQKLSERTRRRDATTRPLGIGGHTRGLDSGRRAPRVACSDCARRRNLPTSACPTRRRSDRPPVTRSRMRSLRASSARCDSRFSTNSFGLADDELRSAIFDWIEWCYNATRRHSCCGMLSAVGCETTRAA